MTNHPNTITELLERAERTLPAGVGGAARFNPSLGYPLYLSRADGARIYDVAGKEYIDFNLSHGANLLGYNHPAIRQALEAAISAGFISGYDTEQTVELAERIVEIIPCAEQVRLVNTGSEGTMVTIRLARAYTGRKKVLKFWGHFHGLYDYVMYNAHLPLSPVQAGTRVPVMQESAGIPSELDDLIVVVPWNDPEAIRKVLQEEGEKIAAIIMEPINYNQGCIVADKSYMEYVRKLATENGIVLIYDEVLSAFRTGPGCAQAYYGVTPDLCVIGKAVANGAPISVVAGKREIMQLCSPAGQVSQSGTFSGNLISVLAANATLREITKEGFYDLIDAVANVLYNELNNLFEKHGIPARVQGLGARFGIYLGFTHEVKSYSDTLDHDSQIAARFIQACANRGVYLHSYGQLVKGHYGFSSAHTLDVIEEALERIESALKDMVTGTKSP
ncbi:MAG: aspartate aminotransferase family protein [Anaerolineales bacterium]|nr:aspartate aminotransferase family protein [Anaerolineales bacterium]